MKDAHSGGRGVLSLALGICVQVAWYRLLFDMLHLSKRDRSEYGSLLPGGVSEYQERSTLCPVAAHLFSGFGGRSSTTEGFKATGLSAINPSAVISAGSWQSSSFERKIKLEPNGWVTVQSHRELAAAFSKSFNVANDCLPKWTHRLRVKNEGNWTTHFLYALWDISFLFLWDAMRIN